MQIGGVPAALQCKPQTANRKPPPPYAANRKPPDSPFVLTRHSCEGRNLFGGGGGFFRLIWRECREWRGNWANLYPANRKEIPAFAGMEKEAEGKGAGIENGGMEKGGGNGKAGRTENENKAENGNKAGRVGNGKFLGRGCKMAVAPLFVI